ncbi:separase PWA37_000388 [Arxiozyma heterogenica]|uniref:separase n=1 Tax=Arxiozyma heterogenica TaxID=278026 RepID=UPI002EEA8EF5
MSKNASALNEIEHNTDFKSKSPTIIPALSKIPSICASNKENLYTSGINYYDDAQYISLNEPLNSFTENKDDINLDILPSLYEIFQKNYSFARNIHSFLLIKQIVRQHLTVIGKLLISKKIEILSKVEKHTLLLFNETNLFKVSSMKEILLQDFTFNNNYYLSTLKIIILQFFLKTRQTQKYQEEILTLFAFDKRYLLRCSQLKQNAAIKILLNLFTILPNAKILFGMKFLEYIDKFNLKFEDYIKNMNSETFRKQLPIYARRTNDLSCIKKYFNSFYINFDITSTNSDLQDCVFQRKETEIGLTEDHLTKFLNRDQNFILQALSSQKTHDSIYNIYKNFLSNKKISLSEKVHHLEICWKAILQSNYLCDQKKSTLIDQTLIFLNSNLKYSKHITDHILSVLSYLKDICILSLDVKRLTNIINLSYNSFVFSKNAQFIINAVDYEIIKYLTFPEIENIDDTFLKLIKFLCLIPDPNTQTEKFKRVYSFYFLSNIESLTQLIKICQSICMRLRKLKTTNILVSLQYASEIQLSIFCSSQNITRENILQSWSSINILFFSSLLGNSKIIHDYTSNFACMKYHFLYKYQVLLQLIYYLNLEMDKHQTVNLYNITKNYIQKWSNQGIKHDKTISSLENIFIKTLLQYLYICGFYGPILELYELIQAHKDYYHLLISYSEMWMVRSLVSLQYTSKLDKICDAYYPLDENLLKLLSFNERLTYLETYIELYTWKNDFNSFKELFCIIIPQEYQELYDIHNQGKMAVSHYIKILLFNIHLHAATSKFYFNKNRFIESVIEAKKALRLSVSLIKKVDKLSQIFRLSILRCIIFSFQNLINIFCSLGLAKEASYYTNELSRVLPTLHEPTLIFQGFDCLYQFYTITEQETLRISTLKKINNVFQHIQSNYDIHTLCQYLYLNNEYSRIIESLKSYFMNIPSAQEDYGFLENYWRLKIGEFIDDSICRPQHTVTNFLNKIQTKYNNLLKNIEADPFLRTLFESTLALPSSKTAISKSKYQPLLKNEYIIGHVTSDKESPKSSNMIPKSKNIRQGFDRFIVTRRLKDIIDNIKDVSIDKVSNIELRKLSSLYSIVLSIYFNIVSDQELLQNDLRYWFYLTELSRNIPLFYDKQLCSLDKNIYDEVGLCPLTENLKIAQYTKWNTRYNFEDSSLNFNAIFFDICKITDSIILSKYSSASNKWTMLRIPLKGSNSRDLDSEYFSFQGGFKEMQDIIEQNNMTTSSKVTSSIKTVEQRRKWWNKRYELDKRLDILLQKITNNWFGGFKGFCNPDVIDKKLFIEFVEQFNQILHEFLPSRKHTSNNTGYVQIEEWILELFLKLNPNDSLYISQLEDLLYFVFDILLYQGEENAYDEIDIGQMHIQITDAIRRYRGNLKFQACINQRSKNEKSHIFLLISSTCHSFPWESLPIFKNMSITRIPSLNMLDQLLIRNKMELTLRLSLTKNIGMILNPNNDLLRTETTFKDLFTRIFESTVNSRLLINQKPTELDLLDIITKSVIFIYVGHGSGEQYLKLKQIKSCDSIAATFLLGCSSASMKYYGKLESTGPIYSYLIAGSPLILGNLWDVTDKDIDKFSLSLFEKTGIDKNLQGEVSGYQNVPYAVANSREVCNLKYLNGAAPVVYGLPVQFC